MQAIEIDSNHFRSDTKETGPEEPEVFVDLLTREIRPNRPTSTNDARVHVVITMRSEFLGECARFDDFAELINRTSYLVPRMDSDGLMQAITRPAKLYNGDVSEELAARLFAETRGREDELPLIQHALRLIWNDEKASTPEGQPIRLDIRLIAKAGGARPLLSGHADQVLGEVAKDAERLFIAEQIFRALTDINSDGVAVRRPQKFADIVAVSGGSDDSARSILDAFRSEGVSFITPYAPEQLQAKTQSLISGMRR